ncbi:hypothetical protein RND71_028800 [Anisodus tanguticus]|uniref:Uncharacterized protein n=1 Tax=Anisodus tanguticus TaxID=243964 RepID=A0AAE1RM42_9SOLA|nr:hypothetical protein RND71_028800 [Anisodus tanguticus]
MIISTRNIRGLNKDHKQKKVKLFLAKNKIEVFRCVETRVREQRSKKILKKMTQGWNSCCNYASAPNGRIWIIWRSHMNATILENTEQFIHYLEEDPGTQYTIYFTVVYARNGAQQREVLWNEPSQLTLQMQLPWILRGLF